MSGKKGGKGGNQGGKKPEGDFKFNFGGEGGKQTFDFAGKDAALLPMIQNKLATLVGKSSGYLEELPLPVQNRIKALKNLHEKKVELDKEYKKEMDALQAKFDKLLDPLFNRRREIVQGVSEPTADELKGDKSTETKEEKEAEKKEGKKEEKDVKGIPDFWMEAFKHHDDFAEMVTKKDEAALKHLIDVRWKPVTDAEKWSSASFILELEFSENAFFTNKVLSKTYYLTENDLLGETIFDHLEACEIDWKPGKNLTVKMVQQQVGGGKRGGRKGRGGKSHGQVKTVMVEEPCESFFNFFNQNVAFGLDEEELEDEDMQELLESDYEMGLAVKEQIIPSAVLWFTGEIQDLSPFGEGEEEFDEEGEYDSAEDADFEPDPNAPASADGQKPECTQQ